MFIHQMTDAECQTTLQRMKYGRLACSHDNQPYVVPIYLSYAGGQFYGFSTLGQKVDWMRANPLVCVEFDERTSHSRWTSVVVYGRYEELPDTPELRDERFQAHRLLQQRAMWWEPAHLSMTP